MGCVVVVVLLLRVVPGLAPVQSALWMSWIEREELRWRRGERGFSTVSVRMVFRFSLGWVVVSWDSWGEGGERGECNARLEEFP